MRKPDKPALRKVLLKDEHIVNVYAVVPSSYVLDGGALLHKVRWSKSSTYKDLAMSHASYVRHHYSTATIVFDGYNKPASTKTNAHARISSVRCQDIVINESNVFYSSQEKFLSNENNKKSFIILISKYLEEDDQTVVKCDGDADTSTVSAAIRLASPKNDNPFIVVVNDTDIAIMLLYHWNVLMSDIIFNSKKSQTAWSMKSACFNFENREHLLFVHAWSGCDTVSAIFGKVKVSFLEFLDQSDELKDLSTSIIDVWADEYDIGPLSEDVFRIMYSGKKHETLTTIRY